MPKNTKDALAGVDVERIRVEAIKDSKLNPRKDWDADQMKELMASISQRGLLQAIIIRKIDKHGAHEVVCGSRRLEAHRKLKLEYVSARVVEMDDDQARETAMVENLQREDMAPMDEARAFFALLKSSKLETRTIANISARTGKTETYVARRLKLLELPAKVQKALSSGDLDIEVAMTIARLPDQEAMSRGFAEVCEGYRKMETKEAVKHLTEAFTTPLSKAPFDTSDAELVPKAGPCTVCPHRSGNQIGLFNDLTRNVCTKPSCFSKKKKAHFDAMAKSAKEKGLEVIKGNEAYSALNGYSQSYVKLGQRCDEDPKGRSYQALLGKKASDLVQVVAVDSANNRAQKVVSKPEVVKLLKDKGYTWAKKELVDRPADKEKDERKKRLAGLTEKWFIALAMDKIASRTESADNMSLILARMMRVVAIPQNDDHRALNFMAAAIYGKKFKDDKDEEGFDEQDLQKLVDSGNGNQALATHVGLYLVRCLGWNGSPTEAKNVLESIGADQADLKKDAVIRAKKELQKIEEEEKAVAADVVQPEEQDDDDEGGENV